jgi:hypothetical protein
MTSGGSDEDQRCSSRYWLIRRELCGEKERDMTHGIKRGAENREDVTENAVKTILVKRRLLFQHMYGSK